MARPLLIDCDPGHDDAVALLLALASPEEVELVGVTTVGGNQTLERTTANALRVLEAVGREDVPVAAGASRPLVREAAAAADVHGETGLDGPDLPPARGRPVDAHAIDFMAEKLLASAEPLTLVAVGPLTNVALLLARHPEAAARIGRIAVMGGAIAEGNVTPAAEFNIWCDPEAARRVFESGLDVTMVGLDATHAARVDPSHHEALRAGGRAGALVVELLEFYGGFHRRIYGWDGSPIHDALTLAHVIVPGILRTERLHVAIETESELCRGRTVVDRWRRTGLQPNASVAVEVPDPEAFPRLLVERLGRL